jgi:hypothetical protein
MELRAFCDVTLSLLHWWRRFEELQCLDFWDEVVQKDFLILKMEGDTAVLRKIRYYERSFTSAHRRRPYSLFMN